MNLNGTGFLLITLLTSSSVYAAGAQIENKRTGEVIQVTCETEDCATYRFEARMGSSISAVKEGINGQAMVQHLEKFMQLQPEYFPLWKAWTEDENTTGHIMLAFPLMWFITVPAIVGDAIYSGGVYSFKALPSKSRIKKLKADVSKLLHEEGTIRLKEKRFDRLKAFFVSLPNA